MVTKEKIIEAARVEFMAKGYDSASLRDITKSMGITVTNIYRFFTSKEVLFQEIIGEVKLDRYGAENHPEEFVMLLERKLAGRQKLIKKLTGLKADVLLSLL